MDLWVIKVKKFYFTYLSLLVKILHVNGIGVF